MAWNNYANGRTQSASDRGWVEEGSTKLFVFSEEPTRCRFLTEDISVEDIMSMNKVLREEAEDILFTKISQERWVMPKSVWEHQIKEIPGRRFFSTAVCYGRGKCVMCDANAAAKEQGISENKLLPYPVRKRFIVPAYFYDMGMVLFVRAAEEFFDGVADYVNKHGANCDFDIYKTGKGLQTKYKAVFVGESKNVPEGGYPKIDVSPKDLNLLCDETELARRLEGGKRETTTTITTAAPSESHNALEVFRLPFGQHKGKTLDEIVKDGNGEYVKFLADNSTGVVQQKAKEFLGIG